MAWAFLPRGSRLDTHRRLRHNAYQILGEGESLGKAVFHLSAGGVVVAEGSDGPVVLLLATERYGKRRWCLPKGHLEEGESVKDAARREVEEEAGIGGTTVLDHLGNVRYFFRLPEDKRLQFKVVQFYLMELPGGPRPPKVDEGEGFVDGRWVSFAQAEELLAYRGERDVVRKAVAAWASKRS